MICNNSFNTRIIDTDIAYTGESFTCGDVTVNTGDSLRKAMEVLLTCQQDVVIAVSGSVLPTDVEGKKVAFVGSGTYTQAGGPDIVVPDGSMGILFWDGSEWSLSQSVEMPDNSAKIEEWVAGTYNKDEVVTVYGVIYRAKEQTNEEPPSDKWEAIGGSVSGKAPILTKYLKDFGQGAIQYNSNTSVYSFASIPRYSNSNVVEVYEGDIVRLTTRIDNRNAIPALIFHTGDINAAETVFSPTNGRVDLVYEVEEDGYLIAQYDRASTPSDDYVELTVFGKERETIKEYPTDNPYYEDISGELSWVDGRVGTQGAVGSLGQFKHSVIKVKAGEVYYMKNFTGVSFTYSFLNFMNENKIGFQGGSPSPQYANLKSGSLIKVENTGWMVMNVSVNDHPVISKVCGLNLAIDSDRLSSENVPYTANTDPQYNTTPEIHSSAHYLFYTPIPVTSGDIISYTVLGSYPVSLLTKDNNLMFLEGIEGVTQNSSFIIDDGQDTEITTSVIEGEVIIPEDGELIIVTRNKATLNSVLYEILDSPAYFEVRKKEPLPITNYKLIQTGNNKLLTLKALGSLPITKERGAPWLLAHLYDGQDKVSSFYVTMKVQGQGSAAYNKKGFTLKPYNKNGEPIKIKVGGMPALDSFHFKAFYSDGTIARDVCNGRLWYDIARSRPFPACLINHNTLLASPDTSDETTFTTDARYFTDGVPVNFELNGEFYGLYVLRMNKHRSNYALDKSDKNQIFLDSNTYKAYLHTGFNYEDWDVRNPKMEGYEESGEVTDLEVLGKINRFFDWMKGVYEGTVDARSTYENFIDLYSFLDWVIVCEVIGNWDVNGNNYNLITWNGDVWSMMLYDTDSTIGVRTNDSTVIDTQTGFVANPQGFIRVFRDVFQNELKDRYQELRGSGVLDFKNFIKIYVDGYMAHIPSELYKKNFDKWGGFQGKKLTSNHIMGYLKSRIEYLDSIWDD